MYRIHFLSIILCFGFTIKASHFRGGTITWKPISNNISAGGIVSIIITQTYCWTWSQIGCNSSMIATQSPLINLGTRTGSGADLMCNASCSTSGGYVGHEVPITGYCTDFSTTLDLTVSQRSDIVNLTFGAHFTATFGTGGGWQSLALGSSSGWSLSSVIDLRPRSDNGLINTPPVATCISYISVPVNIQQTIPIPVLDADNDFIRCRFANGSSECVNTCPPGSLPSGTSLSSSCVLTITGPTVGAYYLVPVQVEDFITNTSTTPLSSVPLQFLIYVYATPNCTLKPLLISDLSSNSCQGAQVGVNFTMTFTAINRCGSGRTMSDIGTLSFPIIIKGPLIQNTTNTSLWSMKITWIPTANQVGSQVFCAVAEDSANVQSDQYCVTIFVGLNNVPLCPGVTTTSTTTPTTTAVTNASSTAQITPIITSSAISTAIASQLSTEAASTMMDITSSSSVETSAVSISSTLSTSTTAKPKQTINWPLILGLSLAALALALCCSCCCWYHLLGPGAYRRRRKKTKAPEYNSQWRQENRNFYQKFLQRCGRQQHYERQCGNSIVSTSISQIPSSVTVNKINQREKSIIDGKSNVAAKQSCSSESKRCVSVQRIDHRNKTTESLILDKISQENLTPKPSSTLEEYDHFLLTPLSTSTPVQILSVNVIQPPRMLKSSVKPHRSASSISVKRQSRKTSHSDTNRSRRTKINPQSTSNVSVTKIKRSVSSTQINHHTVMSSSNMDQNRIKPIS